MRLSEAVVRFVDLWDRLDASVYDPKAEGRPKGEGGNDGFCEEHVERSDCCRVKKRFERRRAGWN